MLGTGKESVGVCGFVCADWEAEKWGQENVGDRESKMLRQVGDREREGGSEKRSVGDRERE
jgi:hypothetical protein